MDNSFDMDAHMAGAPNYGGNRQRRGGNGRNNGNNQNQNQNFQANGQQGRNGNGHGNGNRGNGGRNQNNQNGHQNGNNNGRRNGNNGRNNRNNGRSNASSPGLDDLCYMHKRGNHTNRECTVSANVHHPDHQNGEIRQDRKFGQNNHQSQQNEHSKPQNNRHGNIRNNHGPLPTAEHNYCERCNTIGHTAVTCENPPAWARLVCSMCKNRGHSYLECAHPLCCQNCRGKGHTAEACHKDPSPETLLLGPAVRFARGALPTIQPQPNQAVQYRFQPELPHQYQQQQVRGATKATFGPDFTADKPLDEFTAELLHLKALKDAERRHAIVSKCWASQTMYSQKLLNDEILEGECFFGRINRDDPQITLPANKTATDALARLLCNFIEFRPFANAAHFISRGWNYFRDPRAVEAIARCQVPSCNGCARQGKILDATLQPVPLGTDVLTIDDWDVWGVSIALPCHCCRNVGYSFVRSPEDDMDWES